MSLLFAKIDSPNTPFLLFEFAASFYHLSFRLGALVWAVYILSLGLGMSSRDAIEKRKNKSQLKGKSVFEIC